MTTALPAVTQVLPPGCSRPGCAHHYHQVQPEGCICVGWHSGRGWHMFAAAQLCPVHHTVMELIEDAACDLAMRGYLDLDDEEIPPEVVALLLEIYLAGECGLCPDWLSPGALADHALYRWQTEYEQGLPLWSCTCGATYKILWEGHEEFYQITEDGCLGDRAGFIKRNSKGKVKHSDACPACGRDFAATVARQTNPQQPLFDGM